MITSLTASFIKKRLIIANCCSVKKGYDYLINYSERGKSNQSKLDEIETLLSFIDSIINYTQTINGIDIVLGNICITQAQINNILDGICKICDAPCTSYVNFN